MERTENCYICTLCGLAAGDGDGFIGAECKVPIDGFSGEPIPEWPMRSRIMEILEDVKSGKTSIPVARENLIYLIRKDLDDLSFSAGKEEGLKEGEAKAVERIRKELVSIMPTDHEDFCGVIHCTCGLLWRARTMEKVYAILIAPPTPKEK